MPIPLVYQRWFICFVVFCLGFVSVFTAPLMSLLGLCYNGFFACIHMSPKPSILVTTYNIHKGMSPLNRLVRLEEMASALKAHAPDILCLQEVQGQHLKRAVDYNEYPDQGQHDWFGEYLATHKTYGKNAQYKEGHHGNAVLSRHRLDPKHNHNISVNRLEQRGVLHCEVHPQGFPLPIVVLCAHLNLFEHDRQKQYKSIIAYIKKAQDTGDLHPDQPLIVAGDFNDWRALASRSLERLGLVEAVYATHGRFMPSFPAVFPVLSLDRIYVKNLTVKSAWVHTGAPWRGLSDHLPISAHLELAG